MAFPCGQVDFVVGAFAGQEQADYVVVESAEATQMGRVAAAGRAERLEDAAGIEEERRCE